jgi:hypothetical protein
MAEIMEWGYDSDRGRQALARINRFHSHYKISNDDFLYVLSTFHLKPIRWLARFGWRPLTDHGTRATREPRLRLRPPAPTRRRLTETVCSRLRLTD